MRIMDIASRAACNERAILMHLTSSGYLSMMAFLPPSLYGLLPGFVRK